MTSYASDFLDPTTGLLEQLVLAVIAQQKANLNYVPTALETDLTKTAINWNVATDTLNGVSTATLFLTIQLQHSNYNHDCLLDKPDYGKRISSLNATDVGQLGISTKATYARKSFPTTNLPAYLLDFTSVGYQFQNTLERRIMELCLKIEATKQWVRRWNNLVYTWQVLSYQQPVKISLYGLIELSDIEAQRDALLDELTTGIPLFAGKLIGYGAGNGEISSDNPNNAQESSDGYDGGISDPAGSGSLPSSSIRDILSAGGSDSDYGTPSDNGSGAAQESPTLADC